MPVVKGWLRMELLLPPSVLVPGTAVTRMLTLIGSLKLLVNCAAANAFAAFMSVMFCAVKPAAVNVASGS